MRCSFFGMYALITLACVLHLNATDTHREELLNRYADEPCFSTVTSEQELEDCKMIKQLLLAVEKKKLQKLTPDKALIYPILFSDETLIYPIAGALIGFGVDQLYKTEDLYKIGFLIGFITTIVIEKPRLNMQDILQRFHNRDLANNKNAFLFYKNLQWAYIQKEHDLYAQVTKMDQILSSSLRNLATSQLSENMQK